MGVFTYDLCFETIECINLKSYPHNRRGLEDALIHLEYLKDKVLNAKITSTKDYETIYEYDKQKRVTEMV